MRCREAPASISRAGSSVTRLSLIADRDLSRLPPLVHPHMPFLFIIFCAQPSLLSCMYFWSKPMFCGPFHPKQRKEEKTYNILVPSESAQHIRPACVCPCHGVQFPPFDPPTPPSPNTNLDLLTVARTI